jgi:Kef-type K+ transport system membrane component KefB
MQTGQIISTIFLVFTGAALIAAVALYARQSLLVAYIVLGGILGPWGLGLVTDLPTIRDIGHVGIMFLLFLLGLNLHPQKLLKLLQKATLVTLASSAVFALIGFLVGWGFGFSVKENLVIGAVMMFSSTIIGLKLLPTTALHHRHVGEVIISVLLLQDIIAIALLILLEGLSASGVDWSQLGMLAVALPGLILFAFLFERFVLIRLIRRFDAIQEFVFLAAIGWCLGLAQLGVLVGLTYEIGAFIAGVTLAYSPIARFIAESLKPLRDFFLIMFFFSLGAGFELPMLGQVIVPATLLALLMLAIKPFVFRALLSHSGESRKLSWEVGVRLGQTSEFSLLIAVLAVESVTISQPVSYLIQATTILTFIASAYLIMLRFPTPISVSDQLRRD